MVKAILAQRDYAPTPLKAAEHATPLDVFWQLLHNAWAWFWDRFPLGRLSDPHVLGLSGWVIIGAVAVVLFLLAAGRVAFALSRSSTTPRPSLFTLTPRPPADWRREAASLAQRGDFARAIGALFAAALAALDERGIIAFDATRAPGEYRRAVRRARAAAAPPFDDLTERFVRATYAQEPVDRAAFEGALAALDRFEPQSR